jgi:hypothetical protein
MRLTYAEKGDWFAHFGIQIGDTPKNGKFLQQFSGIQNSDRKLTGQ